MKPKQRSNFAKRIKDPITKIALQTMIIIDKEDSSMFIEWLMWYIILGKNKSKII